MSGIINWYTGEVELRLRNLETKLVRLRWFGERRVEEDMQTGGDGLREGAAKGV